MSATPLPEQSPASPPRSSVRPLLLLLIGLCLLFIVTYALRLDTRDRMEAAILLQQQTNDEALARGAALQKELANASQPSYVDKIARTDLLLVRAGETVLVPVGGGATAAAPAAADAPAALPPIWQQWLQFLFPRN